MKVQFLVYNETSISISNIIVTGDELSILNDILTWLRTEEYGSFTIEKHASTIYCKIEKRDRREKVQLLK